MTRINLLPLLILLSLSFLFVFSGCRKDLDFSSDTFHDVKDVIRSQNCNVDCGEIADCEGMEIRLRGIYDGSSIATNSRFDLIDENDDDFDIMIDIEEDVLTSVIQKMSGSGNQIVRVTGIMEGFDANTNFSCERRLFMTVNDPDQVSVE